MRFDNNFGGDHVGQSDAMPKPGFWCRVADKLGVVADVGTLTGRTLAGGSHTGRSLPTGSGDSRRIAGGDGSEGLFPRLVTRWVERHVAACARCHSEGAEWARIAERLGDVERPVAPASLYDGLMAKIAVERAEERITAGSRSRIIAGSRSRITGRAEPRIMDAAPRGIGHVGRRGPLPDTERPLAPLLALALGWIVVVTTIAPLSGSLEQTSALARAVADDAWGYLLQLLAPALQTAATAISIIPPALEPVALALAWGAFGWGVTVAVLAVSTKLSEVS